MTVTDAFGIACSGASISIGNSYGEEICRFRQQAASQRRRAQASFTLTAIHSGNVNGASVNLTVAGGASGSFGLKIFPSLYNWAIQCEVDYYDAQGDIQHFDTDPSNWPYYVNNQPTSNAATAIITGAVQDQADAEGYDVEAVDVIHFTYVAAN